MNAWLAALAIAAAVNPFAAAASLAGAPRPPLPAVLIAAAATGAAYVLAGSFAGGILDALSLEPESFLVAAGVILAASGAAILVFGAPAYRPAWRSPLEGLVPIALPLLVAPAGLAAVIAVSVRESAALAVITALAAVAAGLALCASPRRPRELLDALGRFSAALAVVAAAAFAVDGIRSI